MKKIILLTIMALAGTILFSSCKIKIERIFYDIFNATDDPTIIRERAIKRNMEDNKKIKIGLASSWTQNITDAHDAVMLALDEVNSGKKILGCDIELIEEDDMAKINQGTRVAYKLSEDKEICAVLGHAFSDISASASLVYNYYGILMFSPISSSHSITKQKDSLIFRNVPDDSYFGKVAADFCDYKGWKNIAIYYADLTFAESIANSFELGCGTKNISIATRDNFSLYQTETEYRNLFRRWKNNYKFDSIFIIGNMPNIEIIINEIRNAGITQPILGSDAFDDPRLINKYLDKENETLYTITTFDEESQNVKFLEFVKKFEEKYGHVPDQEGIQWYDAFCVLTKAIEKAGSPEPKKVAEVLRNETWNEAAGPYTFDNHGDVQGKALVIKTIQDGVYKVIAR